MKILVVQDYLRSGGTERQSVLLATAFAQAGHDTHLITFRPGGALLPSAPISGLSIKSLQRRDTKLDWWAPGLAKRAKSISPDVVLCMGRMANCYAGAVQRALPDKAVITTMRTGKNLPWAFRKSLQNCRHTIANSQAARDLLVEEHQLPKTEISVIANALVFGPSPAPSRETITATREQFQTAPDDIVLLDVAMFRPEKNQIALIEIAAQLPKDIPWKLWLAGEGPALEACQNRLKSMSLSDRVKLLGWIADPRPLYQAADIAVHASRSESLSNFLIEAQAHGLPAVAYAAQGVDETFIDGESGTLIAPDDEDAFLSALLDLFRDTNKRREMGRAGQAQAQQRFSADAQIKAHLDLFEKLISLPSSA
ncbi:MAG: hypothetical protein SynsKO_33650 [Synoicihabitans sp.]